MRVKEVFSMETNLAQWSLILLCFSLAGSFGGGLYEHIVLTPIWSASPRSSFAIIQRGTGVPLQRFWIPVHAAITGFILWALLLTWNDPTVRRLLLIARFSSICPRFREPFEIISFLCTPLQPGRVDILRVDIFPPC